MAMEAQLGSSGGTSAAAQSYGDKTLKGMADLIKLLPTGTVFLFQFLNPLVTDNGHCAAANKVLTGVLLAACGLSCCFSCFTDSYRGADGKVHYGVVTAKGLLPLGDPAAGAASADFSGYRLRFGDFVHAALCLVVFAVVSLLDPNTVSCYFPDVKAAQLKILLIVLPSAIGASAGVIFMMFPWKRHGIGYPPASDDKAAPSSSPSPS